jgi:hypothetical protein
LLTNDSSTGSAPTSLNFTLSSDTRAEVASYNGPPIICQIARVNFVWACTFPGLSFASGSYWLEISACVARGPICAWVSTNVSLAESSSFVLATQFVYGVVCSSLVVSSSLVPCNCVANATSSLVLGQTNFFSGVNASVSKFVSSPTCKSGSLSASGVFAQVQEVNGTLWVSDPGNHRVLRFDKNSTTASAVWGQNQNMNRCVSAQFGSRQETFWSPSGVTVDTLELRGSCANATVEVVLVSDTLQNRVVWFFQQTYSLSYCSSPDGFFACGSTPSRCFDCSTPPRCFDYAANPFDVVVNDVVVNHLYEFEYSRQMTTVGRPLFGEVMSLHFLFGSDLLVFLHCRYGPRSFHQKD